MSGMIKGILIVFSTVVFLPVLYFISPTIFSLLLLAGIIILKLKYPIIKGAVGEWFVNRTLSKLGPSYKIYHDLYVPNGEGGTTQVDHVVTSPFGIFVIETKHYQGWIFGKEDQRFWTQVIYKRKEKFLNPIWQNYGHIQALKNYFGNEDFETMYSIIAFSNNSTLKFNDDFKSARVIQFKQLLKVIKEWNLHRLSEKELKNINRALEGLSIKGKKEKRQVKKQHVDTIRNNRKEKVRFEKDKIKQNICPQCRGELSIKKGKYGSFYGCRNFPKCRYTKQVS
ncbi:NERD domain-containing protein [Peribacillus alkalitolerans]|uniref:NERD domain-containing protein n=1 Tax=Peribacillus alkalitolerans TaxID=1550385 RepID=UPI0013D1397E|nr:NERD domain-containing protein [Peribacillus alkalitolerans]